MSVEYEFNSVFDAAWKLSETVEPTRNWARALGWLYAKLSMKSYSIKAPLKVAERWQPNPTNAELVDREGSDEISSHLSKFEMVRMGLARLATQHNEKLLKELLTHEDRAFRAAAYMDYPLTGDMLISAHEKDGELAFQSAIDNLHLWRSADGRDALRSLAWEANDKEAYRHLDAPNQFNSYCEHMEEKHPSWFRGESGAEEAEKIHLDDRPATTGVLARLRALLTTKDSEKQVKLDKRATWTLSLTAFTAIYVFFKLH